MRPPAVHIKKVEIFGFKSFGFSNTTVQFEPGLVSISGPNGSGKSNVLDAIIFAMGENRPRVMRVDKLHSLLHDVEGARRRGPKVARASVTFDNSDRRLPVDADSVEITREMSDGGENTYFLNRKQVTRTHILDTLDMANAGLGQLNAVQQGTVTRISDFTSDERRKTIEDLVGLSYFDEKKQEAEKQLAEADQRLAVAMAKMGEIKKRIDELEEERNQKLRRGAVESEIARLEAISAARKLRAVSESLGSRRAELEKVDAGSAELKSELERVSAESARIEAAKNSVVTKAGEHGRERTQVSSQISESVQIYERASGAIAAAQRRLAEIGSRAPKIGEEIGAAESRRAESASRAGALEKSASEARARAQESESRLEGIDAERAGVLDRQAKEARESSEHESRARKLADEAAGLRVELARAEAEAGQKERIAGHAAGQRERYGSESERLARLLAGYERRIRNHKAALDGIGAQDAALSARRAKTQLEIAELEQILDRSSRAASQYEAKIRVMRGVMHEDYTVARIQEDAARLGVEGLAYQKISWDARYERAVLAAGSDWFKALLVRDMSTMLGLAEAARSRGLPRLRIIPMEAVPDLAPPGARGRGILGPLSGYVRAQKGYEKLAAFLFGDVVLASSRESARRAASAGQRAVTLEGDLFEARAGALVIDISSKISKLTRFITMSSSVDGLLRSISQLKRHAARRRAAVQKIDASVSALRDRRAISEKALVSAEQSLSDLRRRAGSVSSALESAGRRASSYSGAAEQLRKSASDSLARASELEARAEQIRAESGPEGRESVADDLERLNSAKARAESDVREASTQLARHSADLASERDAASRLQSRAEQLAQELESLRSERQELVSRVRSSAWLRFECDARLQSARAREQELIASEVPVEQLRMYDEQLRGLVEQERALGRRVSALERRHDALERDVRDMSGERDVLRKKLASSGLDPGAETFEVGPLLAGLQAELRSLAEINAKAPEAYIEASGGYRSMSERKNSLEGERNSIVRFIESVEKEKRQTFLEAFDKVDREIRAIFSKMTGGSAWLELQSEDDIFSSGISYMIQFKNKTKRESSSISGGEKTLAAVVFVLALQRLQPSPFYLFDEVDAHLDAPNSESLSRILEERAAESQFIMVSLKDSVVEKARLIYGVYGRNGVSQIVTYKDKRAPRIS